MVLLDVLLILLVVPGFGSGLLFRFGRGLGFGRGSALPGAWVAVRIRPKNTGCTPQGAAKVAAVHRNAADPPCLLRLQSMVTEATHLAGCVALSSFV